MKLADNALATYNVVHQMSMAPSSLYQPYLSPWSYWAKLNQAANTYGNSQSWMNSANTGSNASAAYQQASVAPYWTGRWLRELEPCQGSSKLLRTVQHVDLNDSVSASNLQTLGTIRANAQQRQTAITAFAVADTVE